MKNCSELLCENETAGSQIRDLYREYDSVTIHYTPHLASDLLHFLPNSNICILRLSPDMHRKQALDVSYPP